MRRSTGAFLQRLPKVEIVANFGVGYDSHRRRRGRQRSIVVTNTPDVLTEEVADTALGLLLVTVRELPQAERSLRAGRWTAQGDYPLTRATLRDRTVGIVGARPHRQGHRAAAGSVRRAGRLSRPQPQKDVAYRYYAEPRRHGARRRHR